MREADPPESYSVIARELGLSKTTVRRHLSDPGSPSGRDLSG